MTTRDFKAMQASPSDALKRKQDEVFEQLKRAENQSRAAIVAPEEVQEEATTALKDAIALCEEYCALGTEC